MYVLSAGESSVFRFEHNNTIGTLVHEHLTISLPKLIIIELANPLRRKLTTQSTNQALNRPVEYPIDISLY